MRTRALALVITLAILSCCGSPQPTADAVATQVSVMRAAAATLTAEATVLWTAQPTATEPRAEVATATSTTTPEPSPTHTHTASPSPVPPTVTLVPVTRQVEPSPTTAVPTASSTPPPTRTPRPRPVPTTAPTREPTLSPTESAPHAVGSITFSAGGRLHVVDVATGADRITPIPDMRQPALRADGDLIIAKGFQGARTSLWTIDAHTGGFVREQSGFSDDFRPFWSPEGARFVYDSLHLGRGHHTLYLQQLDTGVDEMLHYNGEAIIGMSPVWMHDDWIAFTGCDYWPGGGGGSNCGIYRMPSWSGRPFIVHSGSLTLRATDSYGGQLLLMSEESGDWEVYVKPVAGGPARNLSNSPGSHDGLGTFSPDGELAAFVSNRGGMWAMWVVALDGSGLTRLFELPDVLTGVWTEESISWGP